MPQVKKVCVREAILAAGFDLFCRKGYTATTMSEIARAADMTVANLYVYFDSKLLLFYEIYTPWLLESVEKLRQSVEKFRTPRTRLRRIIVGLWGDIPAADHSFVNAMIEALSSAPRDTLKPNNLLEQCEIVVTELIVACLPPERVHLATNRLLSHILWMAHDGFTINRRIGDTRDLESIATLVADLLLGPEEPAIPARSRQRSRRAARSKKREPST
jgi:AcrR family transcriptional regulator